MTSSTIEKKRLLIIGDSNTYGWDPRDFFGRPYEKPWPMFLKEAGYCVGVDAVPGCEIPHAPQLMEETASIVRAEAPDILLLMLGSNDILNQDRPEAALPADRMAGLLTKIRNEILGKMEIVLMGIPPIRIPGGFPEAGTQYNRQLERLSQEKECRYFKTPEDLPLAYDGVHLTEEGHRILGEAITDFLEKEGLTS